MAQFQVFRLASGVLVVDCQSDDLADLPSRFVLPLLDPDQVPDPIKALHPVILIDGREMLLAAHAGAAISRNHLGKPLQSLESHRYAILSALDFLITGV